MLLALGALSSCIIGPKQDDPESSLAVPSDYDSGIGAAADSGDDRIADATIPETSSSADSGGTMDPCSGGGDACEPEVGSGDANDAASDAAVSDAAVSDANDAGAAVTDAGEASDAAESGADDALGGD
jgi:hypothetical protein